MLVDLNRLIRCFEIYLACCINNASIIKISPDIKNLNVDRVVSFNYTNTYTRIYSISEIKNVECDYIHGKADINNTIELNNMVLGIDEYLPKKRRNKDIEFIAFKKYYQRIYKGTGCKYKEWVEKISDNKKEVESYFENDSCAHIPFMKYESRNKGHYLYIFGHSLDITDKDILKDLILNDNVYTTIFYHKTYDDTGKDDNGRKDLGEKIANLVKVIGQKS